MSSRHSGRPQRERVDPGRREAPSSDHNPVPGPPNASPWPDDHQLTDFQRAIVQAVRALRPGELVTYGELAEEVGRPGSAQAVANVLRSAPGLPWWRVLPSDGRMYRSHAADAGATDCC